MVLVSVADTGIGIAPENHQRIFQKFSQVGDTLRDRPQGTGLGLAICKEIVEHYGGRIWFESEPGKGSTFFFTLPVAVDGKAQPSPETPPPAVTAVRRGTILVVDDEANIRHFISHELSKHGHKVIEADSGKQAIDLARQHHPDLITLDVLMPDLNGFDVTAILKNDPQTQDIPILIVSVVEDRKRALQLGASDYITKPCSIEKLLEKVNHLLPVSQKTILIVDDDKALVRSLETELNKRGFATQRAYNGREALKAVERYHPDLILIDIRMPEMDGYETIKALKSNPETSGIHIIVMTGIEIDDGRVKALSIGAEDYFKKSGSIDQLIQAVERILSTGKKSAG
jgi:CheY-like chemotaxis protein